MRNWSGWQSAVNIVNKKAKKPITLDLLFSVIEDGWPELLDNDSHFVDADESRIKLIHSIDDYVPSNQKKTVLNAINKALSQGNVEFKWKIELFVLRVRIKRRHNVITEQKFSLLETFHEITSGLHKGFDALPIQNSDVALGHLLLSLFICCGFIDKRKIIAFFSFSNPFVNIYEKNELVWLQLPSDINDGRQLIDEKWSVGFSTELLLRLWHQSEHKINIDTNECERSLLYFINKYLEKYVNHETAGFTSLTYLLEIIDIGLRMQIDNTAVDYCVGGVKTHGMDRLTLLRKLGHGIL